MAKPINFVLTAGLSVLLGGCGADVSSNSSPAHRPQGAIVVNGIVVNGIVVNGIVVNGIPTGALGSVPGGFQGMGWNGSSFTNPGVAPDWGLDPWINDPGISISDRQARLSGLPYWTTCACSATDHLSWSGTNPSTGLPMTQTFDGSMGLAPTWCTGLGPVPTNELEATSACLYSRVNTKGIHNVLSIRGHESSMALSDNERLFMSYPEGQFIGHDFGITPSFQDPVSGLFYKNDKPVACYFPPLGSGAQLLKDLGTIIGRTCEIDGCGGGVHTALSCTQDGNTDGAKSLAFADPALTIPVGFTADPITGFSGPSNSTANGYPDWLTGTSNAVHYNKSKRRLSVFLGAWADLETGNWKGAGYQCDSTCGGSDGCACYDRYCSSSFEGGGGGGGQFCEAPSFCNNCQTIVRHPGPTCWGTDATCKGSDCVRNHKLTSLAIGCWLPIQFTRPFDVMSGAPVGGVANMHKAGTLTFRYSHPGPGPAGILLQDVIRGTPISAGSFAPTGSTNTYADHVVYPIYPGRSTFSGPLPGIEIALATDPSRAFPELDYAQIRIGAPFGQPAREMYWETKDAPFVQGETVCLSVTVDSNTDFATAGDIRIRPDLSGASAQNLNITVTHDGVQATYTVDPSDQPWSNWISDFQSHTPTNGTWDVCINSAGSAGTLHGVSLEMKK